LPSYVWQGMEILETLYKEITDFFGFKGLFEILSSGDYSKLLTRQGMMDALTPLVPILLVVELVRTYLYRKLSFVQYKISFFTYVFNRFISRFISIGMVALCIGLFEPYAIFKSAFSWYWFVYGYIVWELAHFVYHYLGHKVRLFWCLHSTHHAPEYMNLSVTYTHFFLEAPYADLIRTTICILLGVSPALLVVIMFIDGTWGALIHLGENILKDGRLGFLNKLILTPSHHRVHHARNPLYMDTNYCNLLNIWDRVFGTLQEELPEEAVEYGITRPMKSGDFLDAYFGEITLLAKDVYKAPTLKDKILYILMPPGWHHSGDHKTADVAKKIYKAQKRI
jgi:sterol desaturase/sphingolipid hydroxylase (fatty acid hydroxylase superfamily)